MKKVFTIILFACICASPKAQTSDSLTMQQALYAIDSLQHKVDQLSVFQKKLLQLYAGYLEKPFSQITADSLQDIMKTIGLCGDDATDIYQQAVRRSEAKQLYDRCLDVLKRPYDKDKVKAIRDSLVKPRKLAHDRRWEALNMNRRQWQELDSLDIFLSRYQYGVSLLRAIIEQCNADYERDQLDARKASDVALSRDYRADIISKKDKTKLTPTREVSRNGNVADFILLIPWLKQRYDLFIGERNPLDPSANTEQAIKEIMEINIE